MNKPRFTKGPWRTGKDYGAIVADTKISNASDEDELEIYGGYVIAESVSECNKFLIAAAPDLYEALGRMTRLLQENYQLDDLAEQVIAQAEAALKKARGE